MTALTSGRSTSSSSSALLATTTGQSRAPHSSPPPFEQDEHAASDMTAAAQDLVLQTRQRVLDHARAAAHAAFRLAATQRHASGTASCATAGDH